MAETSIRRGVAQRVAAGIVLLLLLDSAACYYVASHFANLIHDRWLADSARSLSKALSVDGDVAAFDLPRMALEVIQYDELDKSWFRIESQQNGFLAGERALPLAQVSPGADLALTDAALAGQPVRLAAVRVAMPSLNDTITVEVGETVRKRAELRTEILLVLALPQLGLLVMALGLAWLGIARGLKPLTDLANHIAARGYSNLSPLSEQGLPQETRVVVHRINDLLSRLEQSVVAQRRFFADAAHQLRTPLAAIQLYAERAQQARNAQDVQTALQGVRNTAERSVRVSQQLLALARTEPEARALIEFGPVDLAALARVVGEEWIPRALAEDIDFGLSVPERPVYINGNAALLGELLNNLIDNAFRYSGRGSRVSLAVTDDGAPTLVLEDNGPGIPPEERLRIFERFHRLDRQGPSGCGLGLAIVRQIADMHQADVQVGDVLEGVGAGFRVSFPPCRSNATG